MHAKMCYTQWSVRTVGPPITALRLVVGPPNTAPRLGLYRKDGQRLDVLLNWSPGP